MVVAVGTGDTRQMVGPTQSTMGVEFSGKLGWVTSALEITMNGSNSLNVMMLEDILNNSGDEDDHFYFIQADIPEELMALDTTSKEHIDGLKHVANTVVRKERRKIDDIVKTLHHIRDEGESVSSPTVSDSSSDSGSEGEKTPRVRVSPKTEGVRSKDTPAEAHSAAHEEAGDSVEDQYIDTSEEARAFHSKLQPLRKKSVARGGDEDKAKFHPVEHTSSFRSGQAKGESKPEGADEIEE